MPVLTYIPALVEEHFEEIAFLLHLRASQITSGRMLYWQLIDLDDRIEGHVQGLHAAAEGAIELSTKHIGGKDPLMMGAAVFAFLALNHSAAYEKCLALLSNPATAPVVLPAMLLRCAPGFAANLKPVAQNTAAPQAAVAMALQARHFPRDLNQLEFAKLLTHADPAVRAISWGVAQNLPEPRTAMQYKVGCVDAVPAVRDAALTAAAWAGQPTLLDACRPFLKKADPSALVPLRLFAILAPAAEASAVCQLATAVALGPARFDLLAASGLPAVVPLLLGAMRDADAAVASAAADAFERLTNFQSPSKGVKTLTPPGATPDALEKEFLPEVNIPDPDAAARYWSSVEGTLGKAARIARGMAVEPPPADTALVDLDCAAREAVLMRRAATPEGKKHATWASRWSLPQRAP